MSFRDHPLCGPSEGRPAAFWGPERLDHKAWVEFADRIDTDDEIDLIIEALGDAEDILDVGGGTGLISRAIAARFGRCVVVEPSVDQAREITAAPGSIIELVPGRAESLPVRDRTYDAVLATWMLQYTDDPAVGLGEMVRACRATSGSRVVLVQAAPDNQIVDIYNIEARVAEQPPAHHGFLLAMAADMLAEHGFDVDLRLCPTTVLTPENNPRLLSDLFQRLHFAGHPLAAQIRAATESVITGYLTESPGSLKNNGVLLCAVRE